MIDKICPIHVLGSKCYNNRCIGEDCMWFLNFAGDCAIPTMVGILADSTICQNIFKVEKRYVEQEANNETD